MCSDTCPLHAMTNLSQLATNVCVSTMTNIVVEKSSCHFNHLYHTGWEGTQIQCLTLLLAIHFSREALEIVYYHIEDVYEILGN